MRDADPVRGKAVVVAVAQVHAVRAPHVAGQPADVGQVLDRRAAVALAAELVLVGGLGQVRVQLQAEPPRERRGLLHQLARDRERRARRDGDLHEVAVGQRGHALGVGQDLVERLDERVGRQAAVRLAEIHRAARRRRSADPARARPGARPRGCPVRPAREDVVVVEDRRAARERELGQSRARRGVLGLGVEAGPHRIQLDEPLEERGVLRAGSRERLVEVVVRVDEARRDDRAAEVEAIAGLGLGAPADLCDEAVAHEHPAAVVLAARVVHRDDVPAPQEQLTHPATPGGSRAGRPPSGARTARCPRTPRSSPSRDSSCRCAGLRRARR